MRRRPRSRCVEWDSDGGAIADVHSQERIQAKKAKEEAKAEKARYEKLAEKMHKKRVERLKRREKRNKALKER